MGKTIRTTCPYCGVGCGVIAEQDASGSYRIQGDPAHPSNFGRLCSKGAALADTLDLEGRLLVPEIDGKQTDWETALQYVADELNEIIAKHGPDAVAIYASGQLLTEDYYVANKLMKGFIGSANIDTNSRLCMSSAVSAHKRAFGSDTVPSAYEDLERADLIVLIGSNTAWCHPVLYQRIARAKQDNPAMRVVLIDPRRTATAELADLHLPIKPGADNFLFNGLLAHLAQQGLADQGFVDNCTEGLEDALSAARAQCPDSATVAQLCGLEQADVERFFDWFGSTGRTVSLFSQGINQWSYGTDKGNAIINCHLYTGRIGRPGMGPFSITGQPNAMGGREVGGLANQLAAHMDIANPEHRRTVQSFWRSPVIAEQEGYKAVQMFERLHAGDIKAVWIMATNPAVSLPNADFVREALSRCERVIVSDCMRTTDTSRYAHVLLPSLTWGERDGTVTNSERRISRQRAFLPPPGEARADWWVISQVAQRMGFAEHFDYPNPAAVFREHATLSGADNGGARDFDISGLAGLEARDYDDMTPVQWPINRTGGAGTVRMFGDGRFFTPNGRARFVSVKASHPANATSDAYPWMLNSGRVRDQWHTMTRTGKSARLSGHIFEPFVEVHPEDASRQGLEEGGLARVSTAWNEVIVRVKLSDGQRRGSVFMPMHWNDQYASKSYVDALVNPEVDPWSGQPEFKHTPVRVQAYIPSWYGFILSRERLELSDTAYWSLSRRQGMWRYEIAGNDTPEDWADHARSMLCRDKGKVDWVEYYDKHAKRYRAARVEDQRLESCVFIGPGHDLPEREWLENLFSQERLDDAARTSLLSGKPLGAQQDFGRVVCACYNVGIRSIEDAIRNQALTTVEQVGEALKAGTNCGSCQPEIKKLIAQALDAA